MSYCIEQFGPERSMFESNFPVDKVSYSYNVMYNAFKRMSKDYPASERRGHVPRYGGASLSSRCVRRSSD